MFKAIVSVCDHSGAWSRPFIEKGYLVIRVDPKHGAVDHGGRGLTPGYAGSGELVEMEDGGFGIGLTAAGFVRRLECDGGRLTIGGNDMDVVGVLLAPPCTDFASSGARWFKDKDADGRTEASAEIVRDCLRIVELLRPEWWVLEQPVGRIKRVVPEVGEVKMRFNPADFAGWADDPQSEAYTKKTCLYGEFETGLIDDPWDPEYYTDSKGNRGSWMWAKLGGNSERTKELRSVTPTGFARAFCEAQTRILK